MKSFIFHICSWVAALWFSLAPLHASETDWPSPDALMRDTILTAVQVHPDKGEENIKNFIR